MPRVQPQEVAVVANAAAAEAAAAAPGPSSTDIYAGISTIPISASLIGSGVDANDLNWDDCRVNDGPSKNKKQVTWNRFWNFRNYLCNA